MLATTTPTAATRRRGTVVLLHVDQATGGAGHFVVYAVNVQARLRQLRAGTGPPLIAAAVAAASDLKLTYIWSGGRGSERPCGELLVGCASCPICRAASGGQEVTGGRCEVAVQPAGECGGRGSP